MVQRPSCRCKSVRPASARARRLPCALLAGRCGRLRRGLGPLDVREQTRRLAPREDHEDAVNRRADVHEARNVVRIVIRGRIVGLVRLRNVANHEAGCGELSFLVAHYGVGLEDSWYMNRSTLGDVDASPSAASKKYDAAS